MSKMGLTAQVSDGKAVSVHACAEGVWSDAEIVGAFEGFGMCLGNVVERMAKDLREERRHKFVMDCCAALNKKMMELTEKY